MNLRERFQRTPKTGERPATSLESLGNDVLLMICDLLKEPRRPRYPDLKLPDSPLKCLSMVNKRFHALFAPTIFRWLQFDFLQFSMEEEAETLEEVASNHHLHASVRFD